MGKSLRNRQQFHGRTHGFQKFSSDFSSSQGFMRWVAGCYRQLGFGLMGHFLFEAVEPPMVGCWPSSHVKSSMDFPQTIQLLGYPHDCGKPHLHPLYCNFRSNIIFHTSIWISQIGIIQRHPTSLSRSIRDSSFYVMSGPVLCALNPHSQSLSTHIESYIYTYNYICNYIYIIYIIYTYIYKSGEFRLETRFRRGGSGGSTITVVPPPMTRCSDAERKDSDGGVNGTLVVVTWSQTWDERLERMCIYIYILCIYIYCV